MEVSIPVALPFFPSSLPLWPLGRSVPYLKFPNALPGDVLAVGQQGAASVGSHVEAVGCQHREQVAPLELDTEVEGELSPGAEGAEGCY